MDAEMNEWIKKNNELMIFIVWPQSGDLVQKPATGIQNDSMQNEKMNEWMNEYEN